MRFTMFTASVMIALIAACSDSPTDPDREPEPAGTVDDAGGTVTSKDGEVSLTFPAGAVDGSTEITVEPTEEVPQDPKLIPGTAFDFGPDGIVFAEPVTLTIRYDPAELPEGVAETSLALHKAVGSGWQRIEGSTVDLDAKTVSGSIGGFSVYGVLSLGDPASLEAHEGSDQTGTPGHAVGIAPAVRVLNDKGDPLPGIAVAFAVTAGDGTVTGAADTTDASGTASVGSWVLGALGENSLTATVEGLDPVVFTATAVEPCDFSAPYALGETVESELGDLDCIDADGRYVEFYRLELDEPRSITLTMESDQFPPFIGASDEAGTFVVTQYVASPGFTRAVLAPGSYRLAARSSEAATGGAYALAVAEASHDVDGCDVSGNVFVTPGVSVSGELTAGNCHDEYGDPEDLWDGYQLNMIEGRTYTITLSADTAVKLSIWGADGEHKDLAGTSRAGTVSLTYTATQPGFHGIYALGRPGTSYQIAFAVAEAVDPCTTAAPYTVGTTAIGVLSDRDCIDGNGRYVDHYRLETDEQLSVSLSMTADGFTPFVGALDAADSFVVTQYTASPGFTRAIFAPGSYRLTARAVEAGVGGMYQLTASATPHDVNQCGVAANVFVTPGITADGQVTDQDCVDEIGDPADHWDAYNVYLVEGQTITATLSLDAAGKLALWNSEGQNAHYEATPESGSITITYTATGSGFHTYYALARPGASYEFTLSAVDANGAAATASLSADGTFPEPLTEMRRRR